MSVKTVKLHAEAREFLLRGVDTVGRTVGVTLGPRGRNVLIERRHASPWVSSDGYTIARHVSLFDQIEDMGGRIIRHVGSKVADDVGDGTTTAMVIASAIIQEGMRAVAGGLDPIGLRRGIEFALPIALKNISGHASPAISSSMIAKIGTISANGDAEIGSVLASAIDHVGREGVVNIEDGKGIETDLLIHDGMSFDCGYTSPYFVTDNDAMSVNLENTYILLYDKKISTVDAILPALRAFAKSKHSLLVIAENIEGEALSTLVMNKRESGLRTVAVKAPSFGQWRKPILEDIAIVTGGQIVTDELGNTLENLRPESLGSAKRVQVTRDRTTIIGGAGDPQVIKNRCKELRNAIEEEKYLSFDREKLQERLARLVSGIAVIRLGGTSETELRERKERATGALNAARAAADEGILPGGGVSLLRASHTLSMINAKTVDQKKGIQIMRQALAAPSRQIAANAGADPSYVVARILQNENPNWGYDAQTGHYCDLVEAGIIDPTKVVKTALRYAISAGVSVITTEAAVAARTC
jgi:chaperonin GroEL